MSLEAVEKVVHAVLYEGYVLYPYRASALKNRQRFNFGTLYPEGWSQFQNGSDAWSMKTECLVAGKAPVVSVLVRFLHIVSRRVGRFSHSVWNLSEDNLPNYDLVEQLTVGDAVYANWDEAAEQTVSSVDVGLSLMNEKPLQIPICLPAQTNYEPLRDTTDQTVGLLIRSRNAIEGLVEISTTRIEPELFKIGVEIRNLTPFGGNEEMDRSAALARSLASTHIILTADRGQFVSLLDPREQYRGAAAACRNIGCWPVLVGESDKNNMMLASPIILYDYPEVAPESSGEFFDGTEIDEMLALRVMTLTDDEKRQMRGMDERVRRILERTETMPDEQMGRLHGAVRQRHDTIDT